MHHLATAICGPTDATAVVCDVFVELWGSPDDFDPGAGSVFSLLLARTQELALAMAQSGNPHDQRPLPDDAAVVLAGGGIRCEELGALLGMTHTSVHLATRRGLLALAGTTRTAASPTLQGPTSSAPDGQSMSRT